MKSDYYWIGSILLLVAISLSWSKEAVSPAVYLLDTSPWAALVFVGLIVGIIIWRKTR